MNFFFIVKSDQKQYNFKTSNSYFNLKNRIIYDDKFKFNFIEKNKNIFL